MALGNVVSAGIAGANTLDRIETIRADGRIDGADPRIAALTGRIEARFLGTGDGANLLAGFRRAADIVAQAEAEAGPTVRFEGTPTPATMRVVQLTAVMDCAEEAARTGAPVIADGRIKFSGDLAKAIAAGAEAAMVGSMLAGTDVAPGELFLHQGRSYKAYRGMGSVSAMARGSADRYFQSEVSEQALVPEGIEGQVPCKGSVGAVLHQMVGGLRAAMGYTGNCTIAAMRGGCRFVKITKCRAARKPRPRRAHHPREPGLPHGAVTRRRRACLRTASGRAGRAASRPASKRTASSW